MWAWREVLAEQRRRLGLLRQAFEQGNHERILQRGYAMLYKDEQRLTGVQQTAAGELLQVRMQDGERDVRVEE